MRQICFLNSHPIFLHTRVFFSSLPIVFSPQVLLFLARLIENGITEADKDAGLLLTSAELKEFLRTRDAQGHDLGEDEEH